MQFYVPEVVSVEQVLLNRSNFDANGRGIRPLIGNYIAWLNFVYCSSEHRQISHN